MGTKFVRNELLAYVFDKLNVNNESDIDQVVYKFYNEDAVKNAKNELWEHYGKKLPRREDRKNTKESAKEKEIRDILSAVKTIDEEYSDKDELPVTFAAVKFCNIPSERFAADCDVRDRLKLLESRVGDLESRPQPAADMRQGPDTPNQVQQQTGNNGTTRPTGHHGAGVNNIAGGARAVDPPTGGRGGGGRDGGGQGGRRWETASTVNYRRAKVVCGENEDETIKPGLVKQDLFVFRVLKSTDDDAVSDYIKRQNNVDFVSCELLAHKDSASKSYHVVLHTMDKDIAMAPGFWPKGVRVREYFKKRTQYTNNGRQRFQNRGQFT